MSPAIPFRASVKSKLTESQRERLRDIDNGDEPTWDEAHFFENAGLITFIGDDASRYVVTNAGRAALKGES